MRIEERTHEVDDKIYILTEEGENKWEIYIDRRIDYLCQQDYNFEPYHVDTEYEFKNFIELNPEYIENIQTQDE